jgi:formylglycine-generating enzyme required for sulfatase activity
MIITKIFSNSAAPSNKYSFYRVFTLMSLFLLLCGAAPVFSQTPKLGTPTLLQQTLNMLPAVPIPGVGNVKLQFGGDVWIASLNGQNLLAGNMEVHETNEGNILLLKQTHTFAQIAWVKTPGKDLILEYKKDQKSISTISREDMDAKLAAIKTSVPSAGQALPAGQVAAAANAALPNALGYDDEKDFTVETINDGSAARITRYNGKNTELKIPPRIGNRPVTEIGDRAFTRKGLTSVVIPESVIFIGNFAFAENQIGSVSIGANVYIANNAFDNAGYNSFSAGFYNSQGRRAGTYSNSWRWVSAPVSGGTAVTAAATTATATTTASASAQPTPPVPQIVLQAGPRNTLLVKGGTIPTKESITVSDFYMSKYEVTQKEYQELMGKNPSRLKGNKLPVEQVRWYDAVEYCNKLSSKDGLTPAYTINGEEVTWNRSADGYRLPTEAEWEYACRAGTTTDFNTGNDITLSQANIYNKALKTNSSNSQKIKPVGSFKPNAWGLYDMHGNVGEWCWDWYNDNLPSGAQIDPTGHTTGTSRVIRGGDYRSVKADSNSSARGKLSPTFSSFSTGFRVARNAK